MKLSTALFLGATALFAGSALAQTSSGPEPVQPNVREKWAKGYDFKLGEACTMMSKNRPGVIKRDACGRWYCGSADRKDISETRPNLAQQMGCVWTIRDLHCVCITASGKAEPIPGLEKYLKK